MHKRCYPDPLKGEKKREKYLKLDLGVYGGFHLPTVALYSLANNLEAYH
jgi:hypothetical protein